MLLTLRPFAPAFFAFNPLTAFSPQLFNPASTKNNNGWQGGCTLRGFPVGGGRNLHNLGMCACRFQKKPRPILLTPSGSILLCAIALLVSLFLLWRSQRKKAAVGRRYVLGQRAVGASTNHVRREMQVFLIGYMIISICEIFTIGGFPLNDKVRIVRCPLPQS